MKDSLTGGRILWHLGFSSPALERAYTTDTFRATALVALVSAAVMIVLQSLLMWVYIGRDIDFTAQLALYATSISLAIVTFFATLSAAISVWHLRRSTATKRASTFHKEVEAWVSTGAISYLWCLNVLMGIVATQVSILEICLGPLAPIIPTCTVLRDGNYPLFATMSLIVMTMFLMLTSSKHAWNILVVTVGFLLTGTGMWVIYAGVDGIPARYYATVGHASFFGTLFLGKLALVSMIGLKDRTAYRALHALAATFRAHAATIAKLRDAQEREAAIEAARASLDYAAHEIRGPVHGIKASLVLLTDFAYLLPKESRNDLNDAKDSAAALEHLCTDVLDVSRIRSGAALPIRPARVDITRNVGNIVKASAPVAIVPIIVDALGVRAHNVLYTDEVRLRQCISNGLTNAAKHTYTGCIVVRLKIREGDAQSTPRVPSPHEQVIVNAPPSTSSAPESAVQGTREVEQPKSKELFLRIEVIDTGGGLAGADPESLFTHFAQGTSSTSARSGGTGLGLAIVRKIAQSMGGWCGLHEAEVDIPSVFVGSKIRRGRYGARTLELDTSVAIGVSTMQGVPSSRRLRARGGGVPVQTLALQRKTPTISSAGSGSPFSIPPPPPPVTPRLARTGTPPTALSVDALATLPSGLTTVMESVGREQREGAVEVAAPQPIAGQHLSQQIAVNEYPPGPYFAMEDGSYHTQSGEDDPHELVILPPGTTVRHCTVFWVDLAIPTFYPTTSRVSIVPSSDSSTTQIGAATVSPDSAGLKRILLVDDEPVNRRLGQRLLEKHRFECDTACDGADAMEKLVNGLPSRLRDWAMSTEQKEGPYTLTMATEERQIVAAHSWGGYDAVILDVNMPRITGDTVAAKLRALGCELPLLAVTGSSSDSEMAQLLGVDVGFNHVLFKPFSSSQLLECLHRGAVARR